MANRSKVPVHAHGWRRRLEPRLVAQSAEPQDAAPVRSHGQGLQLHQEFRASTWRREEDLVALMTDSQAWWPADFGHYDHCSFAWPGPAPARTASATAAAAPVPANSASPPLNSWPDNGTSTSARRLLWPIKQSMARKLSWADLMILAATSRWNRWGSMTFGFAGGRPDVWEPRRVYWAPRTRGWETSATLATGISRVRSGRRSDGG